VPHRVREQRFEIGRIAEIVLLPPTTRKPEAKRSLRKFMVSAFSASTLWRKRA